MATGRKTGGRTPGTPNYGVRELREAAQRYTPESLEILASIARSEDVPAAARVSAISTLMDRAYGKPSQSIEMETSGAITLRIEYVNDWRGGGRGDVSE